MFENRVMKGGTVHVGVMWFIWNWFKCIRSEKPLTQRPWGRSCKNILFQRLYWPFTQQISLSRSEQFWKQNTIFESTNFEFIVANFFFVPSPFKSVTLQWLPWFPVQNNTCVKICNTVHLFFCKWKLHFMNSVEHMYILHLYLYYLSQERSIVAVSHGSKARDSSNNTISVACARTNSV